MLYKIKLRTTNPSKIRELLDDYRPIYDGSGCGHWTNFRRACADAVLYNSGVENHEDSLVGVVDQRHMILEDQNFPTKVTLVSRINHLKNPSAHQKMINDACPDIIKMQLDYMESQLHKSYGKAETIYFELEDDF